ncbi:hypothetical protein DN402_08700 [Streptomyces sp. SW4]|nr:hypothetical protein DN402_08700 [Streptomyces sp. SW4]
MLLRSPGAFEIHLRSLEQAVRFPEDFGRGLAAVSAGQRQQLVVELVKGQVIQAQRSGFTGVRGGVPSGHQHFTFAKHRRRGSPC